MVRIRKHAPSTSGSFVASGGGTVGAAGRKGAKKSAVVMTTGDVDDMQGVKQIGGTPTMPASVQPANILLGTGWTFQQDFAAHVQHYNGPKALKYTKLFTGSTPSASNLTWTSSSSVPFYVKQQHDAGGGGFPVADWNIPLTFCFKTWDLNAFNAQLSAIPSWITEVEWCYQQEADRSNNGNPWDVTDYLNVYQAMETARAAHVNGAKVKLLKCLTSYRQIEFGSADSGGKTGQGVYPSAGASFWATDYMGIGRTWTGQSTPSATGQNWASIRIGLDYYNPLSPWNQNLIITNPTTYLTTKWGNNGSPAWTKQLSDIAAAFGHTPVWCCPEWGCTLACHIVNNVATSYWLETESTGGRFGDYPNGLRRQAEFLQAGHDAMASLGAHHATYWCANGTTGQPTKYFHLDLGHNSAAPLYIDHDFPGSIALIKSWAGN